MQRRQRDKDLLKAHQGLRTTDMDHIMDITEVGNVCKLFNTAEEFNVNRELVCRDGTKCLMCKSLRDTEEME
eukprot:14598543-Heterocapsa_arctica.AAC.1